MKYLFPFIFIITIVGCKTDKKDIATYFGGKILHPKSNYVVLYNYQKPIDTIYLKKDNTFLARLDSITEGLYYFKHGPEHQYVYLSPQDSLLLRLNTWDFDESLVFSGSSAAKNNALINAFLQNEKEKKQFYSLVSLSSEKFKRKIDSILASKEKIITHFFEENPSTSSTFLNILKITHNYPIYSTVEDYLIKNKLEKTTNKAHFLYAYRNKITMGLDSLMFFYPYSNYVMTKIYNDTHQQGYKQETNQFTVALLKMIDKTIKTEELKNKYLRYATVRHFYNETNKTNNQAFHTFFKLNTNIKDKKKVQRLLNDAKKIDIGKKIPNFTITNYAGVTKKISTLTQNKNCVIYFRNPKHYSDEWVATRIKFLTTNHTNTLFFVINLVENTNYSVKNLDLKHQYYLPKNSIAQQFITSKYPRTILVNKRGVVINNFASLASQRIDAQIRALEK